MRFSGSTLSQASEIFFAVDTSRAQKTRDDVYVDGGLGGDDNGTLDSRLDVGAMGSRLTMECEAQRQKNALKFLPMNRAYAWHVLRGRFTMKGKGTLMSS